MVKNRVIVESVVSAGLSAAEAAARYGVSRQWVHTLVARYRSGGWDALQRRSRRPRTSPTATPAHIGGRIVELRAELTGQGLDAGASTIAVMLTREGLPAPSTRTIHRILRHAGVVAPQPRKRPKSSYLRFEADLPNECWQADFTHCKTAAGDAEVLIWLDDHSRFITGITACTTVTGHAVVAAFDAAAAEHGHPASTLTDNGVVFTARFLQGVCAFEMRLAQLGIRQKNGHPGHPQTQGKIERLNQTLKKWLAARELPADTPALQRLLDEFTRHYNHTRPHRALAGRTPADAYTARAKATPQHNPRPTWRIRDDTVDSQGRITLRRANKMHHIGLGYQHTGKHIRAIINDLDIIIIDTDTGEILRELQLDPDKDYQPTGKPPEPPKGSPRRGGRQKQKR